MSLMYYESHQLAPLALSGRVLPTRRDLASGTDRESLRASSQPDLYAVSILFVQVASTNSFNWPSRTASLFPGATRQNLPRRNESDS